MVHSTNDCKIFDQLISSLRCPRTQPFPVGTRQRTVANTPKLEEFRKFKEKIVNFY